MADTQRTQSDLQVKFADNTSGAIIPQWLRDFLESSNPSTGALHFTDPGATTTITQVSTFVKAANTGSLTLPHRFASTVAGQLQYTGLVAVTAQVVFAGSVSSPVANNQVSRFAIAQNGVVVTPSYVRTKLGSAGDTQAIAMNVLLTLNPNDYLEVWLANDTGPNNLTIEHGYLSAIGVLT